MSFRVSLYWEMRVFSWTNRVSESSWCSTSDDACRRPSYAVCSKCVLCLIALSVAVFVSKECETDCIFSSYSCSLSVRVYSSTVPKSVLLITPTKLKRPLLCLVLVFDVVLFCRVNGLTLLMIWVIAPSSCWV